MFLSIITEFLSFILFSQVNGQSFVGMTQNKAVGVLRKCKGKVTIAIAR